MHVFSHASDALLSSKSRQEIVIKKLHRRQAFFFVCTKPIVTARSLSNGCCERRNRKVMILLSSFPGCAGDPPALPKQKCLRLRVLALHRAGLERGQNCLSPETRALNPHKKHCPPQEGAEMQSKLSAPFLSLGGI